MISPLTVPEHGGEGDGRDHGEQERSEGPGQQGRRHVVVGEVDDPAGHRAQAHEQGQDVEEADGGDGHDGRFPGGRRAGNGVVADEDVRQRGGAQEQRQHQREEVDPLGRRALDLEALARPEDLVAGGEDRVVDRHPAAVVVERGVLPQLDPAPGIADGRQELEGVEAAGRGLVPGLAGDRFHVADLASWFSLEAGAPLTVCVPSASLAVNWDSEELDGPGRRVLLGLPPALAAVPEQLDEAQALGLARRPRSATAASSRTSPPPASVAARVWYVRNGTRPPWSGFVDRPRVSTTITSTEREDEQQRALDELHVGRRGHAGRGHDGDDDGADHDDARRRGAGRAAASPGRPRRPSAGSGSRWRRRSVLMAAMSLMPRWLNLASRASVKVYLPRRFRGSATTNRATIQPAR